MVYVDNINVWSGARPPFHKGSCHLMADDIEELHAFAQSIGLKRRWFQPKSSPHYDLTPSKREAAILAGARPVSRAEIVQVIKRLRAQGRT